MVSWCVSLVYGFPAFGFGAATVMISLFLPALYVDRLGVPLSHIGFVTTAVQLFDAVTDPLMGYLSDRAQFSSGRRRPFMLLGSWSLAASFVALFAPPKEGAGTALAWATTFALLTQLGLTCARVPWLAWGIELTNEYDKKTRLVSLRELMYVFGSLAAAVLPLALESMEVFSRLTLMASVWAVAMAVHGTWCFCTVPDTAPTSVTSATTSATVARPTSKTWSFLRHVLEVRAAWSLWLATVLMSMAVVSNALLYPFFVKYVLREEGGLSTLLGLYILLGAVGVPLWAFASHRFDKRRTLAQATLLQGLALLVVFLFVEQGAVPIYSTCIVLAGLSFGGVPVLRFSMLADVADLAQLRSGGKRDEGKLVALFDISSKLAASALVAPGFAVIDLSGYQAGQPDEEQGPASRLAIRIFYALVPALLAMLSALVVFCLYPLDRQQHTEILSELSRPTDADAAIVGKPMKAMNAGGAME